MAKVRLAIIYYTTYGTNFKMAMIAEEAAEAVGAEVRLLKVRETAPEDVVEGQEGWRNTQEMMRPVPEATFEDMNPHGGQETTLISFYTTMMHWGAESGSAGSSADASARASAAAR